MTSLYGVVRGKPPKFFDGNAQAYTNLRFHLDTETFPFYQPLKMQGDPTAEQFSIGLHYKSIKYN